MQFVSNPFTPSFVFRPDTFARACWRKLRPRPECCVVQTAWGDSLEVEPRKFIGAGVYMRGVHELSICEILWRLAAPGELAVDVGANIGVMTSLLSKRVGPRGRVFAFEPHPQTFRRLQENVRRWPRSNVSLFDRAVANRNATATLFEPAVFHLNDGTASLAPANGVGQSFPVGTVRLDDILPAARYGVLKIDVEGLELDVLHGAERALSQARFRDVVFESHSTYPGPAHQFLLERGCQVFAIQSSLRGPRLIELPAPWPGQGSAADYLATIDPARAQKLIAPPGWNVLRKSP